MQAVQGDDRLSAKGRRDKRIEEQHKTLLLLSGQMNRLDSDANLAERLERHQVEDAIGERDKGDMRGTLIDLAVAEQLRNMDPMKLSTSLSMDSMGDAELYAAATLPGILTGLDDDKISRARVNAVYRSNPSQAAANQVAHEARQAANDALRTTYRLAGDGVLPEKRRQIVGKQMYHRFDKSVVEPTGSIPTPSQGRQRGGVTT